MRRTSTLLALLAGLASMAAYRSGGTAFQEQPYQVNSLGRQFNCSRSTLLLCQQAYSEILNPPDSSAAPHILMVNYCAYDSAYAGKVRRLVQRQLPACALADFWEGSAADLTAALNEVDVALIIYPSGGQTSAIRAYGKALTQFVRSGGTVIFTGTHEYSVLQHFGLLELDYGYFCADPDLHGTQPEHPLLAGTPESVQLFNYAYPLDVSDPNFITLADVRGYPVVGYKTLGAGKVIYLGLEYYFDEPTSTRILINALRWVTPQKPAALPATVPVSAGDAASAAPTRALKRSEEILYTGSGSKPAEAIDLKIYPNPYYQKASVDLELTKMAPVSMEMTDESGRLVSVLLPPRTLSAGSYRFDLPAVAPGVYFVRCKVAGRTSVRKVVKTAVQ